MTTGKRALVLVDIQNDFMPDGALPTQDGYDVVPVANALAQHFEIVVATKDWHPPGHISFASSHEGKEPFDTIELHGAQQTLWPDHCVQNTKGAELVPDLKIEPIQEIVEKGVDPEVDSYSGFFDNQKMRATGLGDWLKDRGVTDVYLVGVATDVCVLFTALDARELGFETWLVRDGTRGVEAQEGDVERAIGRMKEVGVRVIDSEDVTGPRPGAATEREASATR
jgi:nicotinamidase/pyrazinamidase